MPVGAGMPANNREIGHFCPASISQAPLRRTETTELTEGGPNAVGGRDAVTPDAPTKVAMRKHLRGGVGMQECFRDRTQHILCVTLRSFIPDAQGTPRPCAGSK